MITLDTGVKIPRHLHFPVKNGDLRLVFLPHDTLTVTDEGVTLLHCTDYHRLVNELREAARYHYRLTLSHRDQSIKPRHLMNQDLVTHWFRSVLDYLLKNKTDILAMYHA
jgi:hypothetical protein